MVYYCIPFLDTSKRLVQTICAVYIFKILQKISKLLYFVKFSIVSYEIFQVKHCLLVEASERVIDTASPIGVNAWYNLDIDI